MTDQELIAAVEKVFEEPGYTPHLDVIVETVDDGATKVVKVERMYSYVDLTFERTEALAGIFGTRNYVVDEWSREGCETCDYGSEYVHTFSFPANRFMARVGDILREAPDV